MLSKLRKFTTSKYNSFEVQSFFKSHVVQNTMCDNSILFSQSKTAPNYGINLVSLTNHNLDKIIGYTLTRKL